jgi:alkylation response protein AidB-like acyl-CoA dehydrogenase
MTRRITMDFGLSEEQELLRSEVRKFLDQNASMEEVRRIVDTPLGYDKSLWDRMAELGWVGLTMPEEHGGVGLDLVTLLVVLEQTGRSLFPSPLISTVLAATAIQRAGSPEQQQRWLPGLAEGSQIGAFALVEETDHLDPEGIALEGEPDDQGVILNGSKLFVPDAGQADLFVVAFRSGSDPEDVSLAVVEKGASGVHVDDYPVMDLTKRMGKLGLEGVRVGPGEILGETGQAWPEISRLIDCGATLVTAEMIGAAEAAVDITVKFANERVQFASPIGRFQAVKQPLAEMHVDVESFRSLTYYAAWALDEEAENGSLAASRAKAYASEAFTRIGIDGVQLHGAVGFTWEYDIQMYLKRSKWARPMFGDSDYHYDRIARLGGL